MKGVTDTRSPIVKAIGAAVATRDVIVERGRLAGQTFTVRSLPMREVQKANDDSHKHLVDVRGWSEQRVYDANNVEESLDRDDCDLEMQIHVLARALVAKPEEGAPAAAVVPLFKDAEELALTLERDEVRHLFIEWHRFQRERSPLTYLETAEEVEAFVEALGKGVKPISHLRSCEPGTLLATAFSMALKLRNLTRQLSSDTSPSSDPSGGSFPPSDSTPQGMVIETSPAGSTT